MSNQGTIRLKVTNGAPAIEKLWNGRFKLEFFCDNNSPREDWYYENVSALLPEYGILQATNFGSGVSEDWEAIPDSVYPDMRLVLAEYPYNVRAGKHYVKLTYETLTASWVEEKAEDTDYELNGLKRVSRTFVALPDTAYDKIVGTSTIDSDGTTLYLGNFKIEKTDAKWELTEVWLEAGTLSISKSSESDGVMSVTTVFFGAEGIAVGPIIAKKTDDYEGLPTISVTTLQDVDGNSIVAGGENLVNSVSGFSQFTYPGIYEVNEATTNSAGYIRVDLQTQLTKSPAQSKVKTSTYFIFQDSSSIVESDYTYASSDGLWSPNHWGSVQIEAYSTSLEVFNDSSAFRGYRTSSQGSSGSISATNVELTWQGRNLFKESSLISFNLDVDKGPPDPIGNTYTLDVQINPAFDDVDGNQYYKKTIVVTDPIPAQPAYASLPYPPTTPPAP